MSKLTFHVEYESGEDIEYPAKELNIHSPQTRGWQSARYCEYPQQIGLALVNPARLTQVQLLSHQSKIATKIEIFVGEGQVYEDATWKRLGYLSLDDNSRSDYQARELKSVYIDCTGSFLKLLVHKCYQNKHNIFGQVGIVAINILGEYISIGGGPGGSGGGGGGAGGAVIPSAVRVSRSEEPVPYDLNLDPDTANRIRQIVAAKERAVEMEDYDAAKRLKAAEGELCGMGIRLSQLESAKRAAVGSEDYDRAKALKVEIDTLRMGIKSTLSTVEQSLGIDMSYDNHHHHPPHHQHGMSNQGPGFGGNPDGRFLPSHHDGRPINGQHMHTGHGGQTGYGGGPAPYQNSGGPNGVEDFKGGYEPSPDHHHSGPYDPPDQDFNGGDAHGDFPRQSPHHPAGGGGGHSGPQHSPHDGPDDYGGGNSHHQGNYGSGPSPGEVGAGGQSEGKDNGDAEDHPLLGIPNFEDLPVPEALPGGALAGEGNELAELVRLLGEYVVRCLLSKQWSLREAALLKFKLELPKLENIGGAADLIPGLCKLIQIGCEDKIAQVFLTTLQLLDDSLPVFERSRIPIRDLQHRLETVASTLVFKLGDNQTRVRDAAMDCLLSLASCRSIGSDFVVRHSMRKLPPRQTGKVWRPLASRLQLLRDLVDEYGIGHVLSVEAVMSFLKENEATSHTSQEVRDGARELTVSLYKRVGGNGYDWEPLLRGLRAKQREEYERAFEDIGEVVSQQLPTLANPTLQQGDLSDFQTEVYADESGEMLDVPPLVILQYFIAGSFIGGPPPRTASRPATTQQQTVRPGSSHQSPRPTSSQPINNGGGGESKVVHDYDESGHDDEAEDEFDEEDHEMESFKDSIMKQLEESAFNIEEAHNILIIHFGTGSGDAVKDGVLAEWCGEVGLTTPVEQMTQDQRMDALDRVAKWLFQ